MRPWIRDRLEAPRPTLSFEFFPPKTEQGAQTLWRTVSQLAQLVPDFVSVTYGAGGSTQDRTLAIVERLRAETELRPVMHLTCVRATVHQLTSLARRLVDLGITDVMALRGDPPDGIGSAWTRAEGGLRYAADLVRLLRSVGPFTIGVAAFPESHPESRSRDDDVRHLAAKCSAGADYAITQFFFDVKQYTRLVEDLRAAGCDTPVVPGVVPVTNPPQTRAFAAKVGATIPLEVDERFRTVEHDRGATHDVGVEVAVELALDLLASGAPGMHFYTMNRAPATREICAELRRAAAL